MRANVRRASCKILKIAFNSFPREDLASQGRGYRIRKFRLGAIMDVFISAISDFLNPMLPSARLLVDLTEGLVIRSIRMQVTNMAAAKKSKAFQSERDRSRPAEIASRSRQ